MTNTEIVLGFRAARERGDAAEVQRFRTLIIQKNQGLVRRMIGRFLRPQNEADQDDAMQAGCMGLLRALEDYDPEKSSFSTYATHWIRDHMQRWAGKTAAVVRPRSASMPASVAKAAALFRGKHGREPAAEDLGVTTEQLAEWSEGSHFVYLDENPSDGDEHGRTEIPSDAAEAEHTIDRMALEATWADAVQGLSPRNIEIAEAVFWNGETVQAVAEKFGFATHANVVKICNRVEERLRRAVARADGPPSSKPREVLVQEHLTRVKKARARHGRA